MKIRSDFVTNSSSSSFILTFKDEKSIADTIRDTFPENIEEKWFKRDEYINQVIDAATDEDSLIERDVLYEVVWDEIHYDIACHLMHTIKEQRNISYKEASHFIWDTEEGNQMIRDEFDRIYKERLETVDDGNIFSIVDFGSAGNGEDGVLESLLSYMPYTIFSANHH